VENRKGTEAGSMKERSDTRGEKEEVDTKLHFFKLNSEISVWGIPKNKRENGEKRVIS